MLITQDLNKKKQALNEEKQLISERLNARKQAIDTQEKYEELAELRRQLALIQSDPTRTKDAKELRKQIRDLEKDLSWDIAEKEAQSAIKMLDDEQKALEQWQQYQENELNDMLKDANSPQLTEELAAVLGDNDMSREERIAKYMDWLAQNDENYKYGTEAMRMQMAQNSEDAWNKMLGFVETYWDEIRAIIEGGAETIANFITEKSAQRGLSETSIELQRINATNMYDAFVSAIKDTAEWDHYHDIVESINSLVDYTYKVEFVEGTLVPLDEYNSYLKWPYERDKTVTDDYVVDDMYEGTGKKEDPYTPTPHPTPGPGPQPSGGGGGGASGLYATGFTYAWGTKWDPLQNKYIAVPVGADSALGMTEEDARSMAGVMTSYNNISQNVKDAGGNDLVAGAAQAVFAMANSFLGNDINQQQQNMDAYWNTDAWFGPQDYMKFWQLNDNVLKGYDYSLTEEKYADEKGQFPDQFFGSPESLATMSAVGEAAGVFKENALTVAEDGQVVNAKPGNYTVETYANGPSAAQGTSPNATVTIKLEPKKKGGLVDYTGPIWIDGTPSEPEAVLNAEETKNLRAMAERLSYVSVPSAVMPNPDMFSQSEGSIGDVYVTINEAEINNDADIDDLAKRVGKAFTKQISKTGFNTASYSF